MSDDDDDGGLRYEQETEQERHEHFAERDNRLLKEHREWLKEFWRNTPSGFGLTRPKRYDNETNEEKEL